MAPKYSILLCNQPYTEYSNKISEWLHSGIKVFWFGSREEVQELKREYEAFAKEFLLLAYEVKIVSKCIIVDGDDRNQFISVLEKACPIFNAAQYLVEHNRSDEHIVVQASAGTGKTKVMIDRIMFLMHMIPDLQMSDIYMITFTNDAANQMNTRLQEMLLSRFHLTGNLRYFRWLEEQSQMNISTIHSFAYSMLKEYGISQSFTRHLKIRNFKYERKELIKDRLEERIQGHATIKSQVGLPLYRANALVDQYWEGFAKLGISRSDLEQMNWGYPMDKKSAALHQLISSVVGDLDEDYFAVKRQQDAIALNDIMRDLQTVLLDGQMPQTDISMKYLFIDEFQDSDLSQIKVAALLVKMMGTKLFVVGDVKQSIYRFRGATDQAFAILKRNLQEIGVNEVRNYILINNYRTAANIMNRMNVYFERWGKENLLLYDGPVVPFHQTAGVMEMIPGSKDTEEHNEVIVETARKQLEALIRRIESSGKEPTEKDRVVMLTRTNGQLTALTELLKRNGISVSVSKDGSFFASEAVRDFYTMIGSYLFADEPKHIFNYLLTPYAGEIEPMDVNEMEQFHGNYEMLVEYISHYLRQTRWEKYYKEFRLRPVMAVIQKMLDYEPVLDHYILDTKKRYRDLGWDERRCNTVTRIQAMQYQADLEKLMELLQRNLGGDKISLYDIYHYLELQIASNRSESEPDIESEDDYTSILCMTVHKSKGLEFDTIIIPYTNRKFPTGVYTEILIDPLTKQVGWNCAPRKNPSEYHFSSRESYMKNDFYDVLKQKDMLKTQAEEARILYVAMTRAINNLYCIVDPDDYYRKWSSLLL